MADLKTEIQMKALVEQLSAYIETFHPILASQSTALVTSNIDGYFESIPEESIMPETPMPQTKVELLAHVDAGWSRLQTATGTSLMLKVRA